MCCDNFCGFSGIGAFCVATIPSTIDLIIPVILNCAPSNGMEKQNDWNLVPFEEMDHNRPC